MNEKLSYSIDQKTFIGHLAYKPGKEKRPAVIVIPTWMGLNAFARAKTEVVAELGYIGYAIDLFGDQIEAKTTDEARELVEPLRADKQIILDRLQKAIESVRNHPLVDENKIALVGFCFGGMCALELAKSGCALSGIVTFHASLGNLTKPDMGGSKIPAPILMLHGYKDTLAPKSDLAALEEELDARGADWQVHTYGEAMHAFTNPKVNMPERSLQYHEKTANRAWLSMENFLTEIFNKTSIL